MKKVIFLILLPLVFAGCTKNPERLYLTDWHLSWHNQWYPATVPGFLHTDLMNNGLIEDPYYGTCEDSCRWVEDRVWVYETCIPKSSLPKADTLWLTFEGLAGQTIIIINNELFGCTDNMFIQYEFPITVDLLDFNDSILQIDIAFWPLNNSIWSTLDEEACEALPSDSAKEAFYGITLPDRRAFTRIAPYQQGWDWGPKLPTCGIWKPAYISNSRNSRESRESRKSRESRGSRIEFLQEKDSIGQSFTFLKDGKPIFCKGANWIPVHSFPVLDDGMKARYRHLLCSAKEANFNMIRVWGGGIYEHDYFYDLCDSLGLMVWQDFNFSTMLYPDNPEMLESIREEAYQNVTRIARHPCVVLWCGNNEVKNGWEDWGWQGVYNWTPEQRRRLEKAMDTIFGYPGSGCNISSTSILAQAVRDCDPLQRPYITTSPLYGWGHPECTTHGDSHYWGVWWGEEPFEAYKDKTGRFMSEYGFQSYPVLSTIQRYCPASQLHIDSPSVRNHQKHGRGREIVDKAMMRYYGFDSRSLNLEDYAYVSQLLQAWGTGYGIFCHLSDPRCAGTLYWQLNDCWPVASWSSIDYYGNWKALHYRAQALFADTVDLNYWRQYYSVYPKDRDYSYKRENRTAFLYTCFPEIVDGKYTVRFTADNDLYDVYIDTEPHIDGHFTRNFFDIKAGETIVTTFIPTDPKTDIGNLEVKVKTLNEIMNRK